MLALPTLEAMLDGTGTAYADGAPLPLRFATFFWGNGVRLDRWTPTATGSAWAVSPELAGLANVKDYVNVVSGYMVKTPNLRGHHTGACGILSGTPMIPLPLNGASYNSKFGGESIDQLVADQIAGTTPFKSRQLGISSAIVYGEGPTLGYISHRGPDAPMKQSFSPAAEFATLFKSLQPRNTNDPTNAIRVKILDTVRDDAKRLQSKLGTADRHRLDAHLTSVNELENQIMALPPPTSAACQLGTAPVDNAKALDATMHAMADIMALAWACDLTRVFSLQYTGSVAQTVFSEIGQSNDEHSASHDSYTGALEDVHNSVTLVMKGLGYLLQKLKATPEGTGNLLDQSCILATSDVADGVAHSLTDYPLVVAGRAGKVLRYPGVHIRGSGNPNASDVLFTVMNATAPSIQNVGSAQGFSSTKISGLLA